MIPFFVRRYNDIDHIAPIVYRMVKDGLQDIVVLCLDLSYDLTDDVRLKFLRERFGVPVDHVYSFYHPGLRRRALVTLLQAARAGDGNGGWQHVRQHLFASLYNRGIWNAAFDLRWAISFLEHFRPKVLVFDWQRPTKNSVLALFNAAAQLRIPTIGVPHGGRIITGNSFTADAWAAGEVTAIGKSWGRLDHLIMPHADFVEMMVAGGMDRNRMTVIGNPRYCCEWVPVIAELLAASPKPSSANDGKLRILYLDHESLYRMHPDRICSGLQRVAALDFVDLIVKPSTSAASKFVRKGDPGISSPALRKVTKVVSDIPTYSLVQWSDVVMGTTTSALLEATVQNKVVIIPRHYHDNSTLYERHGACWAVSDDDQLVAALRTLHADKGSRPYGQTEVERFMTDVVRGGKPDRDVLGDYEALILDVARNGLSGLMKTRPKEV